MKQTLQSFIVGPLNGITGTPSVRLAADDQFQASTGEVHPPGNERSNYTTIILTLAGSNYTFPDTIVDTTDDSSNPNASYTAYIVDGNGKFIRTLFERWTFTASWGSAVSWLQLESFNVDRVPLRDLEAYSKRQADLIWTGLTAPIASTSVAGRVRMSIAPADPANPIAVGANDYATTLRAALTRLSFAPADPTAPIAWGFNDPLVRDAIKIQSVPVSAAAPSTGQFMGYNGSVWLPMSVAAPLFTSTGEILIGADTDASGSDGVRIQTRSIDRLTIANDGLVVIGESGGGFQVLGDYTEHHGTDPLLHKLGHGAGQRPPLVGHGTGTSGDVPTLVNHFFDCTSQPGGQFGVAIQMRSAGVEGTGATPLIYGNYKGALNVGVENTPSIDTDALLFGQTIVFQTNPGPTNRPVAYGLEIDCNNLHSQVPFGETDYPAKAQVGFQILNGGAYHGHRAFTIAATVGGVSGNQWRKGIVIEETGMYDCAIQVGGFDLLDVDGGGCGVVARNYGGESTSFWVERLNDTGSAGGFAFKVSGTNGTELFHIACDGGTIAPWFRTYSADGVQLYKDNGFTDPATPSKGAMFGLNAPGAAIGDDIVFSSYSSTGTAGWRERLRILNQSNVIQFMGVQLLTSRRTGWTSPTGTATRTGYVTGTATTTQLAETLKALIDDLVAHGLIGA